MDSLAPERQELLRVACAGAVQANAVPRASAAVGDHATQPDGRPLLAVNRSQSFCRSTSRPWWNSIDAERLGLILAHAAWPHGCALVHTWDDNGPRIGTAWRRSHHRAVAGVDDGRGGCRRVPAVPEQSGGGDQARQRCGGSIRRIVVGGRRPLAEFVPPRPSRRDGSEIHHPR